MGWNILGKEETTRMKVSTGRFRYKTVMETALTLGNTSFASTLHYQWDLLIHENTQDHYKMSLLTLEHAMIESTSPALNDMFMATKTMMEMFSEVVVTINKQGHIVDVLNQKDILQRYDRVSKQMISLTGGVSMPVNKIYNIPPQDVQEKPRLIKMIQAMEFFEVFFGTIYGRTEYADFNKRRMNHMRNLEYELAFKITTDYNKQAGKRQTLAVQGRSIGVGESNLKKVFGEMPFVAGQPLKFAGAYNGTYLVDNDTGLINQAEVKISEFICPALQGHTTYHLQQVS